MPIRVQRSRAKGWKMPANTVYVGRPTKWGNPFIVCAEQSREMAVGLYDAWLNGWYGATGLPRTPSVAEIQSALRGKDLACWCRLDQPCHADILLELANTQEPR